MMKPLSQFLRFGHGPNAKPPSPAAPVPRAAMQAPPPVPSANTGDALRLAARHARAPAGQDPTLPVVPAEAISAAAPPDDEPVIAAASTDLAPPAEPYRPAIAFVLVQKNEGGLLKSWFNYHRRLTEPEHIHIIDNGSSDPLTMSVLAEIREAGGNVDDTFGAAAAFNRKHEIVLRLINRLQSQDVYDFVIPLDCDEFLATVSDDRVPKYDADTIGAELARHIDTVGPLTMAGSFYNNPHHRGSFFFSRERAVFFAKDPVKTIDLGYHEAETVSGTQSVPTNVVVMHLQYKRFELAKAQAAEKLKLRIPDFSESTIRSFDGTGSHMNKFFLAGARDYGGEFRTDSMTDVERYGPFMELLSRSETALPTDLFSTGDRYKDYRTLIVQDGQTQQAIAEGSSLEEILFIRREIAASTKVAFYRDGMLASLLIDTSEADFLVLDIRRPTARRPVAAKIESGGVAASRSRLVEIDLGDADDLGYPSSPDAGPERYSVDSASYLTPDTGLVVVSGRYRVSVALACLRHVAPGCRFVVPNFWSRPNYHSMLPFFDVVDSEGDSVLLRAGKLIDAEVLGRQIGAHCRDPR